ncbi:hypothetical protein CRYPA_1756 [uncultured Candidatus Thioglobus sp.]|nr:hypothetical protein CRYPA_1756 [uncultured Candidatus Thioglobus sp.]
MTTLTEKITIRLTLDEIRAVEVLAEKKTVARTIILRELINQGLDTKANLSLDLAVESMMILRSLVGSEEDYAKIKQAADHYKQTHGIDNE